ncbi:hypothetical protein ACSDR0_49065 [Streptosporangium sp. G11]|uniref:hypothetical protein n=1 Tax=Streptosporangium sp. G11 TaxID=3436926 RepID=UPI003EC04201
MRTASAWMAIADMWWATTSCNSRAILNRSSATACAARACSAWVSSRARVRRRAYANRPTATTEGTRSGRMMSASACAAVHTIDAAPTTIDTVQPWRALTV